MFTYKPKKTFLTKTLIEIILIGVFIWLCAWVPMYFIMMEEIPGNYLQTSLFWSIIGNLVWIVPAFLIQIPVFKSYRYELLDDEIVVHSGWLTQRVRHVPYRMVTNIEIRRGLLDRLLGIGTLNIETAGNSDPNQKAEARLFGLEDVETIYEEVAACLRAFDEAQQRQPWERTRRPVTEAVDSDEDVLQAILVELKSINNKINN